MIKRLGRGTSSLGELKIGELIDLIGPLGTPFPLVKGKHVVLISGGVGYPPLWLLRKELSESNPICWIHGGNSKMDIFPCNEIWTVDGSIGNKGFVTEGLESYCTKKKVDIIYACGPEAMLKAIASTAKKHGVELVVSMEAYMACGVGVCYGCAIPCGSLENIKYKRVCKDGPVFNADEICWDAL